MERFRLIRLNVVHHYVIGIDGIPCLDPVASRWRSSSNLNNEYGQLSLDSGNTRTRQYGYSAGNRKLRIRILTHRSSSSWSSFQYECCGKHGYIDYSLNSMTVPDSCYFFHNNKREFFPHDKGCLPAVLNSYLGIYRMEKWTHVGLMCYEVSTNGTFAW